MYANCLLGIAALRCGVGSSACPMKTYPHTRRDLPLKRWSLRKRIVLSIAAVVVALGVIWTIWKHSVIGGWVTGPYLAITSWSTEHSRLATGLSIAAAMIAAALALWKLPKWQAAHSQGISSKNRFDREDDARKTLAQVIGGIFVLAGLYSSIQTFNLQQQGELLQREGQITDRYTKAIDQLGAVLPGDKPNLEVRLGGIYALERIARDSPRDQQTIMDVLCTYVRRNSPSKAAVAGRDNSLSSAPGGDSPMPRADIQAILTVIGRRNVSNDGRSGIDLSKTNLIGADFSYAQLANADLSGSNLNKVDFSHADLSGADLTESHLSGAHFEMANLTRADFGKTHVEGAHFDGADVSGADLSSATGLTLQQRSTTKGGS